MKKIAERMSVIRYADKDRAEAYQAGFLDGMTKAQHWISVTDELPEQTMETIKDGDYARAVKPVIAQTRNGNYAIARRQMFLDHGWKWKGSGTFNDSVISWRPIELK
jgi:hypothetical protein